MLMLQPMMYGTGVPFPAHQPSPLMNRLPMTNEHLIGDVMPVEQLRFTQYSIRPCFHAGEHCGKPLTDLVNDLVSGRVCPMNSLPPLEVVWHDGAWRSLCNKRLWCLKAFMGLAGLSHLLVRVHIRKSLPFDWALKNTARDDGWTVQVIGDEATLDASLHEERKESRFFPSGADSPRSSACSLAHLTDAEVRRNCMDPSAEETSDVVGNLLVRVYKHAIKTLILRAESQSETWMTQNSPSSLSPKLCNPSKFLERVNGRNSKSARNERGIVLQQESILAGQASGEGAGKQSGEPEFLAGWSPSGRSRVFATPPGLDHIDDRDPQQLVSSQSENSGRQDFELFGTTVMASSSIPGKQFTQASHRKMPQWLPMQKTSSQQISSPPALPFRQTAAYDVSASPSKANVVSNEYSGAGTFISESRADVRAPIPFKQPAAAPMPFKQPEAAHLSAAGCSNALGSASPMKSSGPSRSPGTMYPPQCESLASDVPLSPPPPPPPKAPSSWNAYRSLSLREASVFPEPDGSAESLHFSQCNHSSDDAEVFRPPPPPPKMPPPRPPLSAQVSGASESQAAEDDDDDDDDEEEEQEHEEDKEEATQNLKEWLEGVDNGGGAFVRHLQGVQKRYKSLDRLLKSVVKEEERNSLSVLSQVDSAFWTEFGIEGLEQQLLWAKAIVDAHKEKATGGASDLLVSNLQHASPKARCRTLFPSEATQHDFEPRESNPSPSIRKLSGLGSLRNSRQHLVPPSSPPPPPPTSSDGPKNNAETKWAKPLNLCAEPVSKQIQANATTDTSEIIQPSPQVNAPAVSTRNAGSDFEEDEEEEDDEVKSSPVARSKGKPLQEKQTGRQSKKTWRQQNSKKQNSQKNMLLANGPKEPEESNESTWHVDLGHAESNESSLYKVESNDLEDDDDEDELGDNENEDEDTPAVQAAAVQESTREHRRERQRLKNERKKDKKKIIMASRAEELKEIDEQIRQLNADDAESERKFLAAVPSHSDTEAAATRDNHNASAPKDKRDFEDDSLTVTGKTPAPSEKSKAVCCLCKSSVHSIGLAPMLGVCKRHLRDLQAEERKLQKIISTDKPSLASIDPQGLSPDAPNFYNSNQTALSSKEELTQCMKYALKSTAPERMDAGRCSKFVELCVKLLQVRTDKASMSKTSNDWVTSLIRLVKWLSFIPHMSLAFVMTLCPDDQDDIKQTLVSFVQLITRVWSPKIWTDCDASSDAEVSLSKANWTTWSHLRPVCKPPDVVTAYKFLKYYGNIWKMDAAGKIAVPQMLHLSTPKKGNQTYCSGVYKLSDTLANGQPTWEHVDGHRFLFWSSDGAWTVGGQEEADAKFDTDTGYIKNQSQSPLQIADTGCNLFPHELPGSWSRWQEGQGSWASDARIMCTATDMKLSLVKVQTPKAYFGTVEVERLCATWFIAEDQLEDFKAVPRNLSKPFSLGELDGVYMIFNPPGITRSKVERKKGYCSFYVAVPHKGQYTLSLRVGETCMTLTHSFSGSDDRGYLNFCKLEPECIQGTLEMSVELLKVNGVPARTQHGVEKHGGDGGMQVVEEEGDEQEDGKRMRDDEGGQLSK
eukprot:TRINITY_DN8853_c0_g3_i1.p1 TRINITY_DN8853_c0_g3~~TRINITY_DN8853_c0_g3_i1.p1  ORF type:complete len:1568 (-),score=287.05 TRINITY_DN8853_c0_g3_i1:377-5080(-)